MADYFTHFSYLLDVGTAENASRALDLYNALTEEGASEEPPSDGFLLSIQPEHGGTKLWMRDDVTGDPERMIQFVKRCATEFDLVGRWGIPVRQHLLAATFRRLRRGRTRARSCDRRDDRLDLYRWLARRGFGRRQSRGLTDHAPRRSAGRFFHACL